MDRAASHYIRMTETPVTSLIARLAVPTIITMLITNIYNLADTAFVGRLGNSASGAVGVVFGLMSIIQAIAFMFGHGAGSILAKLRGLQGILEAQPLSYILACIPAVILIADFMRRMPREDRIQS